MTTPCQADHVTTAVQATVFATKVYNSRPSWSTTQIMAQPAIENCLVQQWFKIYVGSNWWQSQGVPPLPWMFFHQIHMVDNFGLWKCNNLGRRMTRNCLILNSYDYDLCHFMCYVFIKDTCPLFEWVSEYCNPLFEKNPSFQFVCGEYKSMHSHPCPYHILW